MKEKRRERRRREKTSNLNVCGGADCFYYTGTMWTARLADTSLDAVDKSSLIIQHTDKAYTGYELAGVVTHTANRTAATKGKYLTVLNNQQQQRESANKFSQSKQRKTLGLAVR